MTIVNYNKAFGSNEEIREKVAKLSFEARNLRSLRRYTRLKLCKWRTMQSSCKCYVRQL